MTRPDQKQAMQADMQDICSLRSSRTVSIDIQEESSTASPSPLPMPVPKTPRSRRRATRFSHPGAHPSSGLTPIIQRASVATPKRRSASSPLRSSNIRKPPPSRQVVRHTSPYAAPEDSLHQIAQGRVERRSRRNDLREALSRLERENRRKENQAKAEIASLKEDVKARDREIYELQNATIIIDTERIWSLEQQVVDLKAELARRTRINKSQSAVAIMSSSCIDSWKTAESDPFVDNAFIDMSTDEEHFGNSTMAQLQASTPERARSSFLTPPSTSPIVPSTPCLRFSPPAPMSHTGIQAELSDPTKQALEMELASMQRELAELTATLDSYAIFHARLNDVLSAVISDPDDGVEAPSSTEAIEGQLQSLLQAMADQNAALGHLTSAIADLGFPGADAGEMMVSLASGFRTARLELEYLTPGEITLPLTSHGAEVLDLLLTRLRCMAREAKEDENCIDEYHALEQSLRKQINSHASVMEGLKAEMGKAQMLMDARDERLGELEVGNDRLKRAVDGYTRDISELERLVEQLEQEGRSSAETYLMDSKARDELLAAKDARIADLENKMTEAATHTAELMKEMSDQAALTKCQHEASPLVLCEARVSDYETEIRRGEEWLLAAHETISQLRTENSGLKARLDQDGGAAKTAIDSIQSAHRRVIHMSQSILDSPGEPGEPGEPEEPEEPELESQVQRGGKRSRGMTPDSSSDLVGSLTLRGGKKLRRSFAS